MSIQSALARGRAAAERVRMVDSCTITRATGIETTDPISAVVTPTYTQIYSGPCEIKQDKADPRTEEVAEAHLLLVDRILKLPVTSSLGVLAEDRVVVDTCVNDPNLVGRTFRVRGEFDASWTTARRLVIQEVTS